MKINFLDLSHEMPVMVLVGVVIAKHASVVGSADSGIDVCQAVLHHPLALVPDLFLEHRTASFTREMQRLINALLPLEAAFGSFSGLFACRQI